MNKKEIIDNFLYAFNSFSPKQLLPNNSSYDRLKLLIQYENKIHSITGMYKRNCFYIYDMYHKPSWKTFNYLKFPIRKNQKYIKVLYWAVNNIYNKRSNYES